MFGQIIATLPFYTRAYFGIGRYSINKSIGRPPKYRDYHEIKKFSTTTKYKTQNQQPATNNQQPTTNNQQKKVKRKAYPPLEGTPTNPSQHPIFKCNR